MPRKCGQVGMRKKSRRQRKRWGRIRASRAAKAQAAKEKH